MERNASVHVDRRVQRTRSQLQNAMIALIGERPYDAITIQEIADRANVGRTTFYAHFTSKDELFLSCHEMMLGGFPYPHTRAQMLAPDPPQGTAAAYRHLWEARALFDPVIQGRDILIILRQIRDGSARQIKASLAAAFPGIATNLPLDVLANYLAGAKIALVQWWLEQRDGISPEELARALHRLQRAAILDAFNLRES